MSQEYIQPKTQIEDDGIELVEIGKAIWKGKIFIIIITFIFSVSSIFYALSLPNIYRASILLSPVSASGNNNVGGLANQFGGLANLAGINLSGKGGDKAALAIDVMNSRSFIESFVLKHKLVVPLLAIESYNLKTNIFKYKNDTFDNEQQKWVRKVSFPKKEEPSPWEAYKAFKKIFAVSQDKESGMVSVSINYYSPEHAKLWLSNYINDINAYFKQQDEKEAQKAIDYLNIKLGETNIASMQSVFYQLIEEQTKNMMLTQIKDEYVFKIVDPAQVPEERSSPNRALTVILFTIFGVIFSFLFVLVKYFLFKKE